MHLSIVSMLYQSASYVGVFVKKNMWQHHKHLAGQGNYHGRSLFYALM